jgi:glucose-6-phosphate 1-dehydrogenase
MIERMVLFGASGDLTSRLLMPAVAQLAETGLLPPGFTIVGSANADWSTDDFRQHIAGKLEEHATVAPAARDAVVKMLSFQPADVTEPGEIGQVIGDGHREDTLVYLALPPGLLPSVLPGLATAGLRASDSVAIEKPFGTDLASAQYLNKILRVQLPEPTIFWVDHFLSNELVRRIMVLRFINRVFEPTLNAVHVERVDISWLESLTLEGRASYYDGTGALKDMVQNHLMEVMSLILMEQPARSMPTRSGEPASRRCGRWPPRRRSGCAATRSGPATPPARSGPGRCLPTSMNPGWTRAVTPKRMPP